MYLPLDLFADHGYTVEDLLRAPSTAAFEKSCGRPSLCAESSFGKGLPLIRTVDRRLALDLDLFSRGGMRVLDKIRAQDYNVFASASGRFEEGTCGHPAEMPAARFSV